MPGVGDSRKRGELAKQLGPATAARLAVCSGEKGFRKNYAAKPHNASPGMHDIHLTFLSDLTEIMRANSHLISPVVPTTNQWILTLEAIRVPRNLVGHMNFPNGYFATQLMRPMPHCQRCWLSYRLRQIQFL